MLFYFKSVSMNPNKSFISIVGLLAAYVIWIIPAKAEENSTIQAPAVPITGNLLGTGTDEFVVPITILNGRELSMRRESTLGETLNDIPGVSSSYFGPNASRPIIRGMEGDHVQIMQNGVGVLDASALSPDHAVGVDPLIAEQIEIIRGPATVIYSGGAVGGVVNVIDHRIPKESLNGVIGRGEARIGGADNERSSAAVIDIGNGLLAIHADAYIRKNDDLSIPDAAATKLKNIEGGIHPNNGKLTNSAAKSDGGAFGASITFEKGYAGFSYARTNSFYGTVAEPNVKIDMVNDRIDFSSELFDLSSALKRIKFHMVYTDYQHQEINNGNIETTFLNHGIEGTLEGAHTQIGNLVGVLGMQFQNTRFEASGNEAFVPPSHNTKQGFYIYEELPIDQLKLSAGARIDQANIHSSGGARFGSALSREFEPKSLSVGAIYHFDHQWSVETNLAHTERAPSQDELFANGAHIATHQYEKGDLSLSKEMSNGLDGRLCWKTEKNSISLSGFYTKFNNFITLFNTGTNNSGLNVFQAQEIPAIFKGLESEAKFRIYEGHGDLNLNLRGDYVQAKDEHTGKPLPRISPMRLGTGLDYNFGDLASKIDLLYGFKQYRVASNELPTEGYVLINATISYRLRTAFNLEVFAKARNLLNEDIRDHSSFLKEIAPMGGRSVLLGLRGEF